MGRQYSDKDLKLLWGLAAARCAFPDCRFELVSGATDSDAAAILGEIAHIVAASDDGPRANPEIAEEDRNSYENLILFCPTHHTLVDKQPSTYTIETLRSWKAGHEAWVRDRLSLEMPEVGFAELEVLTRGLLNAPEPAAAEFVPLNPREKMDKNGLTHRVRFELTMGLSKAREVREYLADIAKIDIDFPEKVKAGFVQEYRRLLTEGIEGDALFLALHEFSSLRRRDFRLRAAGLAVLAYLFESCEVFEK